MILARCVARISDDAMTYRQCVRPVGHRGHHWAAGIAWLDSGPSQDRHRAAIPEDCMVPVSPVFRIPQKRARKQPDSARGGRSGRTRTNTSRTTRTSPGGSQGRGRRAA